MAVCLAPPPLLHPHAMTLQGPEEELSAPLRPGVERSDKGMEKVIQ